MVHRNDDSQPGPCHQPHRPLTQQQQDVTDFLSLSPLRCFVESQAFHCFPEDLTVPADGDRSQLSQQTTSRAFGHPRQGCFLSAPCWQSRVEAAVSQPSRSRVARVDPETFVGARWQASRHGDSGSRRPFPLAPLPGSWPQRRGAASGHPELAARSHPWQCPTPPAP